MLIRNSSADRGLDGVLEVKWLWDTNIADEDEAALDAVPEVQSTTGANLRWGCMILFDLLGRRWGKRIVWNSYKEDHVLVGVEEGVPAIFFPIVDNV